MTTAVIGATGRVGSDIVRGAEVRASRTWTGLAGSGRVALMDHRDAAEAGVRVLTDPALWGAHHDLTGPVPMSWPEALAPGGRVPPRAPRGVRLTPGQSLLAVD